MSARPSVSMEQLGSHWTDFHEILYLIIFGNSALKTQFPLKSDKKNGSFILRRKYMRDKI